MNDKELAYLWLSYNQVSMHKLEQISREFEALEDIFDKNLVQNSKIEETLKRKLLDTDKLRFLDEMLLLFDKFEVTPITFASPNFPEKLKNIPDAPLVLFTRGNIDLLNKKTISVIGTRKPTTYGKIVCEKFVEKLATSGLVTISGLAYGIDTLVATKTLECGGRTIAVLAGGLDKIYPAENYGLAKRIVDNGGLLISEQFPKTRPQGYMFVLRNRIVSGLGLGTLIIEAGKHSGTMTTARHAIDQGRELFVVPGNITSEQSQGTNMLIDEIPDVFTISPDRILLKLGIKSEDKPEKNKNEQLDIIEIKVLDTLSDGELSFDEICEKTEISASELSVTLIKLEMFGLIKSGAGNHYQKT